MSNNRKHSDNDEKRKLRHMESSFQAIKRPEADVLVAAKRIAQLVGKDIKAMCPDNYEEIIRLMDIYDGVSDYLLSWLRQILKTAREYGEDMPELQKHIHDTEDQRKSFQDLRLTIMNWFRRFEGIPTETERLEQLMSLPTEEEVEAERRLAYKTGGASLLKKKNRP